MSNHGTAMHRRLSKLYTVLSKSGLLSRLFLPPTCKHHTLSSNDVEGLGAIYNMEEDSTLVFAFRENCTRPTFAD